MTQYQQFLGSPDIFEKATGQRITEEQAKTAGLFTPAGLSPQVEQIKTPRPDVKTEVDFAKMAGTSLPVSLISEPVSAPKEGITAPESPKPEAPQITDSYFTSITKDLENKTAALQAEYDKQIKVAQDKQTEVQKQIETYQTGQKKVIDETQPLLAPFREQKEQAERERLKVEENYFANQTLTNELGTLLTEGNDLIKQQKETTGLAVIRNPRIAQTISDVSARVGVIQAVMSARSGQITEAQRLIDRSITAITADNQDQLKYYETLYNFYTSQKDEEGKKLVSLTATEKDYLDKKIDSLKSDLTTTRANAETIKKAMADPDTAFAYAQAGVTLNDSIETINKKLATYAYSKEIKETSLKMAEKGYSYLAPGQTAPAGSEIYTLTDSKGVEKQWYDKPEKATGGGTEETTYEAPEGSVAQIANLVGGFSSVNAQKIFLNAINKLAKQGKEKAVAEKIVGQSLDNIADSENRKRTTAGFKISQQLTRLGGLLDQYEAAGGETGLISGNIQKIKQKLGQIGDSKLANLGTQMLDTLDQLARARTGAVITETEEAFYKRLLPTPDKVGALNKELINGLRDSLMADVESQLRFNITEDGLNMVKQQLPDIFGIEIEEEKKGGLSDEEAYNEFLEATGQTPVQPPQEITPETPKPKEEYKSFKGLETTPSSFNFMNWFK